MEAGKKLVTRHQDLEIYRKAFDAAMTIFELTKAFPRDEIYSLTDQMRRASRSVCANIGEAWRKRRYQAAFVAKLSDAEGEAAETETWIEFAVKCGYLDRETGKGLFIIYEEIIGMLVAMIVSSDRWVLPSGQKNNKQK